MQRAAATRGLAAVLLGMLPLAGCSGGGPAGQTPTLHTRAATAYLLTLDELHVADFAVQEAAHRVGYDSVSAGDAQLAVALRAAGLEDAATIRYFRSVAELATANGFVDVRSTVLRFASVGASHRAFLAEVRHTDAVPGIVPDSTDSLGDEAHADLLRATAPEGTQVLEVTVLIRTANLVEMLVVRGRVGGTSLDDALVLAHRLLAGLAV